MINAFATPLVWRPTAELLINQLSVLIVDDAWVVRERLVDLLSETGLVGHVSQAVDVQSALNQISNWHPKIVILDISMPGTLELRNGLDLLRWIKHHNADTAVIMLTNLTNHGYQETSMRLGAYAFLDKSSEFFLLPDLIQAIALNGSAHGGTGTAPGGFK